MAAAASRRMVVPALIVGLLAAVLMAGCDSGPNPKEVALRATVEALRDELRLVKGAAAAATAVPTAVTPSRSETGSLAAAAAAAKDWWVANHRSTSLWSAGTGGKVVALVPQWTYFLVMETQTGSRLHLFLPGGQRNSYVGDGWVESADLGPIGAPPQGAVDVSTLPQRASPAATPRATAGSDARLLDWQTVNQKTQVGELDLAVNALLLGQESYGGPYGSKITTSSGTKIVLSDLALGYAFRPGVPPTEVHVDFFVVADSSGLEYRGLPVPVINAMPDRFFLSPGQIFRGIVAFIVPKEMKSGRLYFTNFLGRKDPPDRLTVFISSIP